MLILVDSNILAYSADPASLSHQVAQYATRVLLARGEALCVVPQNLYEFWTVATRPVSSRGLGFTPTRTVAELTRIKKIFRFFADSPAIFTEWERLVSQHSVAGKNAHDARIAAAMNVHGITHLLTFNGADFKRFTNLTVIEPSSL